MSCKKTTDYAIQMSIVVIRMSFDCSAGMNSTVSFWIDWFLDEKEKRSKELKMMPGLFGLLQMNKMEHKENKSEKADLLCCVLNAQIPQRLNHVY